MSVKDYWMTQIAETLEFQELANTEDVDLTEALQAIDDLIDDQFIQTATEEGIARRETILSIIPSPTETLEDRRANVALTWNNSLPYTYRKLAERIEAIAGVGGYILTLDHNNYVLSVTLGLASGALLQPVSDVCDEMVPANIVINVDLLYNTYDTLSSLTYDEMTTYTYEELRSSEL